MDKIRRARQYGFISATDLIRKYIDFMGIPADSALGFIEKPDALIRRLEDFN